MEMQHLKTGYLLTKSHLYSTELPVYIGEVEEQKIKEHQNVCRKGKEL